MKRFGATTVVRWMAEPLPKGVRAYMASKGRLYRLKQIRSYNGFIQAVFAGVAGGKFISRSVYALDSIVFLSLDVDLTGLAVEEILDAVALVCSDCWALRDDDDAKRAAAVGATITPHQQVAGYAGPPVANMLWQG